MNEIVYGLYVKRLSPAELNVCRFCVRKKRKMRTISAVPPDEVRIFNLFHQVTQLQPDMVADYPDLICTDCEVGLQETAKHIAAFQEADAFWRKYFERETKEEDSEIKFENGNLPMDEVICSDAGSDNEEAIPEDDQIYSMEVIDDGTFILASELGDIKIEIAHQSQVEEKFSPIALDVANNETLVDECEIEELAMDDQLPLKEEKTSNCNICDEVFDKKSELKNHMNIYHQPNMCAECGEQFSTCRRLSSHMRKHRNKLVAVNGLYTCTVCNESFTKKIAYRKHERTQHKNAVRNCSQCKATFISITRLRKHMMQMHGTEPTMKCDICKALFHSKGQLTTHMRIHVKKPSYVCDICGHELMSLDSVNRHRLKHNPAGSPVEPNDDRRHTENKQAGHLQCLLCSNTYSRSATLRDHMKKKHPIEGAAKWEELVPLMCIKCDEIFPNDDALREHREMHNKFTCSVCKQNMTCKESLEYHMRTHSTKDRPHVCQLCGATYILKTHLAQHTRRVHTLERPHSCHLCTRSFAEKHELAKHMRAVHLQERKFSCDQCDRKFKKRNDLKVHYQSHTGVYRYRCEICNKNFGNSTQFMGHNANKHPNLHAGPQ